MTSYASSTAVATQHEDQTAVSNVWWSRVAAKLERQPALILLLIFSALSLCFIVKSVSVQYPSIIDDEYEYSVQSRYFGKESAVLEHNRWVAPKPNDLYFWIFHSVRWFGDNSYQFAKILNSLLFAAAVFPIYGISRRFLRHVPALLLSVLIVSAPIQCYTVYFMPESCYFLGFWLFVFLFISNLPQRSLMAGTSGGVALGLLTLVKPHALAILAAANLTLIFIALLPRFFDVKRQDTARSFMALNGLWLATVVALHVVFFRHWDLDILASYRGFARIPIPDRLVYLRQVVVIGLENAAYIAPIFGLPIVATVLAASGSVPAGACASTRRLQILSVFAIIACTVLVTMTAAQTALTGQYDRGVGRMQGRYYDFALPLFLIGFYALRSGQPSRRVRELFFSGVLFCLALVIVGWRFLAQVQTVFVGDYPEIAWMTQPHGLGLSVFWPLAVMVLIYYAIAGLKERTTYSIYLALALITGTVLSLSAQHSFDVAIPADRAGALVRSLFDRRERDLGLVLGSEPWIVRRCLFGIDANPVVLELPAGTVIDRRQIGDKVQWVLALNDYDLRVPTTTLLEFPGFKILRVQAIATATSK
jgi:phosphoglycerol transferase